MSKTVKSNLNEMINSAGDGSGLQMPPAFVFVNPKQHRKYKKSNQDFIDGRSKGAKNLFSRINRRKKMKEELENLISEAAPSETERAQKQIAQQKKLNRQKELQSAKDKAKKKMIDKTGEMQTLLKARLADFKKKSSEQQKKVSMKNSYNPEGDTIMESTTLDALEVAMEVATSELTHGEAHFAKIQFDDGTVQNLDNFSAKKIAAVYSQLDDENKERFRYLLNKDAATYQTALDFAVRNI
jgi:hypothetical protein